MEVLLEFSPWLWLIVFAITLFITLKAKDIDAMWFTIGALVTGGFSLFFKDLSFLYQLLIFIVTTLIPLLTLSRLIKNSHKKDKILKNSDAIIGKKILVVEDCNEFNKGRGTLDNSIWTIICQPGYSLKKGEEAIIVAIDNHNLIVKQAN